MKIKNIFVSFLIIASMLMSNVYAVDNVANIYVSPNGSDSATGLSADAPLKTLEAANNKVAEIKGNSQGVNVNIMAGTYNVSDLKFDETNSGSDNAKIVWKAYNGKVILTSEKKIDNSRIEVVDIGTIEKIPLQAQNYVRQVKLTDEELSAIGKIRYTGQNYSSSAAPAYLAQDGKMFEIAGYPNKVNMPIVKDDIELTNSGFIYTITDSRISRWADAKDAYLTGNPVYEWHESSLKIADITNSTITTSEHGGYHELKGTANLRIVNLVEEIDYPGEFYIDRENGYVYFYPLNNTTNSSFSLVTSQKPFATFDGAQYISFENLVFDGTCSTGIIIKNSNFIGLKDCELRNIGKDAVEIIDSKNTTIEGTHIHNIGKTAIRINHSITNEDGTVNEDFVNLTPDNNIIKNCHIEGYGKVTSKNSNAVYLYGIGDTVSHNRIHGADHSAIMFGGNNNIIEYNDIYDVLNTADDAGAIYAGRSWVDGGTEIRYNYIHDNPYADSNEKSAIYLDDFFTGTKVYGNVIANMNAGVKLHASNHNEVQSNVFVNLNSSVRLGNSSGDTDSDVTTLNNKINGLLANGEEFFKSKDGYKTLSANADRDANTLYQRYFDKYDPYDTTGKYSEWNTQFPYLADYVKSNGTHMSPKGNVIKYNATYTGQRSQLDSEAIYLHTQALKSNNTVKFNFLDPETKPVDVYNLDYSGPQEFCGDNFNPVDVTETGIPNEGNLTLNDFGTIYPQNNAYVDPGSIVFIWDEDSGADKYHIIIARDEALTDIVFEGDLEEAYYKHDGLVDGTKYYWTVDAKTSHYLYTNKTKRVNEGVMSFTASQYAGVVTLQNIVYRNGNGNKINAIENASVNAVEFDLTNKFSEDINASATLESFTGAGDLLGKATVTKNVKANETIRAGVGIMTSDDPGAYMILTIDSGNDYELEYRIDSAAMAGQEREDKLAITSVTVKSETGAIVKGATNAITAVVKSLADGEQNIRCIMATYDSDGKLHATNVDTALNPVKKDNEYTFNLSAEVLDKDGAYVKLFFWNDKMQPLVTDYDVQ
ncbi:MAG: right-handed parallel beta-helix repeat-containing protein [Clostridia bacterium]|nr:right-handed parallel beta-helix repeat-containing protein [Clostridia bacterium]